MNCGNLASWSPATPNARVRSSSNGATSRRVMGDHLPVRHAGLVAGDGSWRPGWSGRLAAFEPDRYREGSDLVVGERCGHSPGHSTSAHSIRHDPNQLDDTPDLTCKDGTGRQIVDGGEATRNRKVEGSNPSSGSKTAGQRASLALPTARRHQAVILWVGSSRRRRARPASLHRCAARLPTGLSLGPESGWVYGQAPSRVRYKALPLASHGSGIRRWVALSSWSMTCNLRSIASGRRPPRLS
jgi:hypothetical protein